MENIINGRYYTKDDIQHRIEIIKVLNNENRIANEYLNKALLQKDVDYIGIRNFEDAFTLISSNQTIIDQYTSVVKIYAEQKNLPLPYILINSTT